MQGGRDGRANDGDAGVRHGGSMIMIAKGNRSQQAVLRIEVESLPAFILVDDKGNDFSKRLGL